MAMARTLRTTEELNWESKDDRDVIEILHAWEQARRVRAEREMAAAAAAHGERRFFSAPDGFGGEIGLMVHPESFHYWGQRLGYSCWNDAQFKREYWRDNPAARVKNHARDPKIIVPELPFATTARKRFSKTFGSN